MTFSPKLRIYALHVMKVFAEYFKYTHLVKSFSLLSISNYLFVMLLVLISFHVYASKTHKQYL